MSASTPSKAASREHGAPRWTRSDLEARDTWRMELPQALAAAAERNGEGKNAVNKIAKLRATRHLAKTLRNHLLYGDGVVWLRSSDHLAPVGEPGQRALFEALGRAMGRPIDTYGTLYEVTDRGGEYRREAIPVSQTRAATGFHTDSSGLETLPDLVGLHCLQASPAGGESLISCGLVAHDRLAARNTTLCDRLYRTFVRDLVTPGATRDKPSLLANRFPVFAPSASPGGLDVRYMRYWMERGHEKAGERLTAEDLAAFDAFDEALCDPTLVVSLHLAPGDALWVNNRTVLHNRTGYVDDPERPRRLLRMWVDASAGATT